MEYRGSLGESVEKSSYTPELKKNFTISNKKMFLIKKRG